MTESELVTELLQAEVLTQTKFKPETPHFYWEEFGDWSLSSFRTAIHAACREGNRFPTIRMIHANRPTSHSTGYLDKIRSDKQQYKSMMYDLPAQELPPELASLTNEEMLELLRGEGLDDGDGSLYVKLFRKGNSLIVEQVQLAMKSRCARKVTDEYVF